MLTTDIFRRRVQGRCTGALTIARYFATLGPCPTCPENSLPCLCCCGCRYSAEARWRHRYPCSCSMAGAMKPRHLRRCRMRTWADIISITAISITARLPQRTNKPLPAALAASAIWPAPVIWPCRARNWSLCKQPPVKSPPIWSYSIPSLPHRWFRLLSSAPDAGRVRL